MVCDSGNFPGRYTPRQIGRLMRSAYPQWDGGLYRGLLQKLGLPEGKKLRQFSRGMQDETGHRRRFRPAGRAAGAG